MKDFFVFLRIFLYCDFAVSFDDISDFLVVNNHISIKNNIKFKALFESVIKRKLSIFFWIKEIIQKTSLLKNITIKFGLFIKNNIEFPLETLSVMDEILRGILRVYGNLIKYSFGYD